MTRGLLPRSCALTCPLTSDKRVGPVFGPATFEHTGAPPTVNRESSQICWHMCLDHAARRSGRQLPGKPLQSCHFDSRRPELQPDTYQCSRQQPAHRGGAQFALGSTTVMTVLVGATASPGTFPLSITATAGAQTALFIVTLAAVAPTVPPPQLPYLELPAL